MFGRVSLRSLDACNLRFENVFLPLKRVEFSRFGNEVQMRKMIHKCIFTFSWEMKTRPGGEKKNNRIIMKNPTGPITILEPENQEIGEFCVVHDHRSTDFETLKGSVGKRI